MTYLAPHYSWSRPTSMFDVNNEFFPALNRQITHLFDENSGFPSTTATHCAVPRMSVRENDNGIEIEAELPGVEEKDVELSLNDDILTLKGEKKIERNEFQNECSHQERSFGRFSRSIRLPFEPDPKTVKTHFSKGVLKITLPKSVGGKQHTFKIPVTAVA